MLVRVAKRQALSLPVLLLALAAMMVFGAIAGLKLDGLTLGSAAMAAFALVIALFVISRLRWIRVDGDLLRVNTPYGGDAIDLDGAALGVRVHHSARGGNTYTVYVYDGVQEIDLSDALFESSSERQRQRLGDLLYPDGPPLAAGAEPPNRAAAEVERREQEYRAQQQQAQQVIDDYYASPKARRIPYFIAGGLLLYILAMGAYMYFTGSNL